jgi:hypothetical protein
MRTKFVCCLFFSAGLLVSTSLCAFAKQNRLPVSYGENQFDLFAEIPTKPGGNNVVSSHVELIGSGGIRVNALHENGGAVNGKYLVYVDGSDIAATKLTTVKVDTDFNASAHCAYFVVRSATCTLPSAVGLAGEEILVWNAGPSVSVRYSTVLEQKISGTAPGALSSTTPYKLDRFMSDGSNWYRE